MFSYDICVCIISQRRFYYSLCVHIFLMMHHFIDLSAEILLFSFSWCNMCMQNLTAVFGDLSLKRAVFRIYPSRVPKRRFHYSDAFVFSKPPLSFGTELLYIWESFYLNTLSFIYEPFFLLWFFTILSMLPYSFTTLLPCHPACFLFLKFLSGLSREQLSEVNSSFL